MARAAVTFDFHNTIAQCDEWFDTEVYGLVSGFLRWRADDLAIPVDPETLISADVAYRQLRQGIQENGNELTAERCVATVLDELGLAKDEEEIARGLDDLMRSFVSFARPMPGAVETVVLLKDAGVPLGIVSNAVYHRFLLWTLDSFGIGSTIQSVTSSASAGFYKSRPEIYDVALASLAASSELSIHVGDSHKFDVAGAKRAGMRTVFLTDTPTADGDTVRADLTLPSLVGSAPRILELLSKQAGEFDSYSVSARQ